ncbi:MAG: ABC transporter permease [Clostridia bacterium]|nr:ABC transporter permease [Clostridia bacterium]
MSGKRTRQRRPGAALAAVVTLLLFWELSARTLALPALPGVRETGAALARNAGSLWPHLAASAYRVGAALLLALAAGVPAGLACGRSPALARLAAPVVSVLHPVPKVTFLPVILALAGIGDRSKVIVIALTVVFPILMTTWDAARAVRPEWLWSLQAAGAGRAAILRHVVVPAVLPAVFTSLRVSTGIAVAVLYLSETYATQRGLGYYLTDAWTRFAWDDLYAGIAVMGLFGLALHALLTFLERLVCPWTVRDPSAQ